ncbi:MAG: helix-turn-helix domain-containing protein, partial [Anderseniella sp.]
MKSGKTFLGPKLRQLRTERGITQSSMATALGLSTSYVNLLENNQRSLSVQVLMRISQVYGVDWRDLIEDDTPGKLADLRSIFQDPMFDTVRPDLQELRAALDHSPTLSLSVVTLYNNYRKLTDRLMSSRNVSGEGVIDSEEMLVATPEAIVHDMFRKHKNHFAQLEDAADAFFEGKQVASDEINTYLKNRLGERLGIIVKTVPVSSLP